ncbi:MAG: antibiotic biosynthesis monooxygenase [Planctomycetales bacterium]
MTDSPFADLPEPPYYAVIFSSLKREADQGYSMIAKRMDELVRQAPGFLGAESARRADGFGITVAYFDSLEAIAGWKANSEHQIAQETGKARWYEHYEVRIAKVERAYGKAESRGV